MFTLEEELVVSIIVNNHNYGAFVGAAIDSALAQTYPAIEVIVVDDGSTDNSREVIARYQGKVAPILKTNGGQASALNAGFAASHGEIVIFLDADDVLLPDTAGRVAQAFRANPAAAKVQYRMEIIDANGVRTGKVNPAAHLELSSGDLRVQVLSFPFDLTWMATSGNAFPARVLRQIFPIPEADYRILADFYLSHVTPLFGPVVAFDRVGAYYRVHGANAFLLAHPTLDLPHIRQMIAYARLTERYLVRYAARLGLENSARARPMLSVSSIAERVISYKFDAAHHPLPRDSKRRLFQLGARASLGRFDLLPPLRVMLVFWFAAMLLAPRRPARWLAERFYFPETRGKFNALLSRLHATSPAKFAPPQAKHARAAPAAHVKGL